MKTKNKQLFTIWSEDWAKQVQVEMTETKKNIEKLKQIGRESIGGNFKWEIA